MCFYRINRNAKFFGYLFMFKTVFPTENEYLTLLRTESFNSLPNKGLDLLLADRVGIG